MSGHPTQRMLFERFVIRAATSEMVVMHGLTGTVNNIYFDHEDNKYRYVLCLDHKQDTPSKTRDVANFYENSGDGFCTSLCDSVLPRAKPAPPDSGQCLVCTKASRYTFPFQKEGKCPLLPYCSPSCLAIHKERHEFEGLVLAEQRAASSNSRPEEAGGGQDLTDSVLAQYNRVLLASSIPPGGGQDLTDSVIAQYGPRLGGPYSTDQTAHSRYRRESGPKP